MQNIKTIAFDADDTLWVNESLFRGVEDKFESLINNYLTESDIKGKLYKKEIENLKHFGYGVKGFVLSMIESAIDLTSGEIKGCDIKKIIEWGKEQIHHPVHLLDGASDILKLLKSDYNLMIITKGDLLDQESKISRSGLKKYFNIIEVVSDKNEMVYSDLMNRHNILPSEFMMVGNSLKSDVLPLVELGVCSVHIPFHTTWQHEIVNAEDTNGKKYKELNDIRELPSFLKPQIISKN